MLAPETRVLLTDALRPPDGFRVDTVAATTYSLDLTTLLLAPLSFALFDHERGRDVDDVDPIRLLEAVRRYAEHTTVFCQAGAIHVPSNYRSILAFIEGSVREVIPYTEGRVFHPKVWVIRFSDPSGGYRHRVLCLSRNLTFDRSWDTLLRLDEDDETRERPDPKPLAEFIRALPAMCTRNLDRSRGEQIDSLADTISYARLAPPAPFDSVTIVPLGVGEQSWPFPERMDSVLAISPFVDKASLYKLGSASSELRLVSRPETLDRLGAKTLQRWQTFTLSRAAECEEGVDIAAPERALGEWHRAPEGLHAKTFVCDVGRRAVVVTGSANLTGAAFGGNVEFDILLGGPRSSCGIQATLEGSKEAPGLDRLLESYAVTDPDGITDIAQENSWILELFHQRLAASNPRLQVTARDDDRVGMMLELKLPEDPPGTTRVWPVSLPADTSAAPLGSRAPAWDPMSRRSVTPFLAIETTVGEGDGQVARKCVIEAELHGDVGTRRQDVLREVLRSKDDVLRYLVFLLGDPAYDMLGAADTEYGGRGWDRLGAPRVDVALLEPLVRAAGRDDEALRRVASLVRELSTLQDGDELLPNGFEELWRIVWEVHQEGGHR